MVTHTCSLESDLSTTCHLTDLTSSNISDKVFLQLLIRMKHISSFLRKCSALKTGYTHKILQKDMRNEGKKLVCDALIYN